MVSRRPAKIHQNPMKELVENAVKTRFEESFGPLFPQKVPIDSKTSKTQFFVLFHRLVEFQRNR